MRCYHIYHYFNFITLAFAIVIALLHDLKKILCSKILEELHAFSCMFEAQQLTGMCCRSLDGALLKYPNSLSAPVLLEDHHLPQDSSELHTQGRRFLVLSVGDYPLEVVPGVYNGSVKLLIPLMLGNLVEPHQQLLEISW
jgi:hypothetical protein